jgi:D-threo-aldose 1-dehydrogenase
LGVPAVTLGVTGLVTSGLGFGCAGLYGEPSATRRLQILDAAHASGIRHFDTAPMYGLGLAERELGRFARGRREQIVIATKFGITATGPARAFAPAQGPVRHLFSALPALRQRARATAAAPGVGLGSLIYRESGYDGPAARASLERSLRDLGTDHVDLLFLHDPQPGSARGEDVCAYLEQARDRGLIKAWGIAGEPEPTDRVLQELPVKPAVLQLRDDPLASTEDGRWHGSAPARITFGVLGYAIPRIVEHVRADLERRRRWMERVGRDCGDPEVVAALLLARAVRQNADGVVLFSTTRVAHVRSATEAIADGVPGHGEALDAFGALIDAELRRAGAER